jgi:hypothetical protein
MLFFRFRQTSWSDFFLRKRFHIGTVLLFQFSKDFNEPIVCPDMPLRLEWLSAVSHAGYCHFIICMQMKKN